MENKSLTKVHTEFTDDSSIDFKRYFSLFLSNWYWFAIVIFLSISLAYGINRYSERIFTVSSSLLIKDDQFGSGSNDYGNIFSGAAMFRNQQNLKNEIGILKSFSLNKRVIDSLSEFHITYVRLGRRNIVERRLYKEAPFIVKQRDGIIQPTAKVGVKFLNNESYSVSINGKEEGIYKIGERVEDKGFDFIILSRFAGREIYDVELSNKYLFWFNKPSDIANSYRNRLMIEPIDEAASVVNLTVSGFVPEQESDYLNKLMELYILQGLELKNQTADSTIDFISKQLDLILSKLTDAGKELQNFRSNNTLISLSTEGSVLQDQMKDYDDQLATLELQDNYYNYLIDYTNSRSRNDDIISPTLMGVTDQSLISLIKELNDLQRQANSLRVNLIDTISAVKKADGEILRTKESIRQNITSGQNRIKASIQELRNRIFNTELQIRKLPAIEQEYIRIQRNFELNNTVYTFLLEKQAETGIARASNVSDNRIIDKASNYRSYVIKPKTNRNYLMALLFGLICPAFLILLLDSLNNKVIDKTDIVKRTDVPIVGYINHNDFKSEIPVNEKPGSTLAESFRSIRTNLRFFLKENANPVIAVSSTISAEGKTFVSINLATIYALQGKKVLLIGLDLRRPRIHRVLDVENGRGLSTWLSGNEEFDTVIQKTEIENLYYAPSGPVPPNPAELIGSERMKEFISVARSKFDLIIIDTPPLAIVTDALLISAYTDAYLLVVRQRHTNKNTLHLIQDLYKNGTIKNPSIVINDISISGYYGYGLRYGYYTGYGYTYGYNYYNSGYYSGYISKKDDGNGYYRE